MSGFNNPIIGGGGTLVYPAIKSPDFSLTNQTGWAIMKNGDAYFFNITAEGTITASEFIGTDFQINSDGVFFYNGTPASGNLMLSLASQAGSDTYGNSFPQGLALSPDAAPGIVLALKNGNALQYFPSGVTNEANNAAFQITSSGSGTAGSSRLILKSAEMTSVLDYVAVALRGNSDDGSTTLTQIQFVYQDASNVSHAYGTIDASGANLTGAITAVKPGTGTRATPAAAESWNAISLASGWSNVGGTTASYRMLPDGNVQLAGRLSHASFSSNTVITNTALPAAYRPSSDQYLPQFNSGNAALQIGTDGNLTALTGSAVTGCVFGGNYPLGL